MMCSQGPIMYVILQLHQNVHLNESYCWFSVSCHLKQIKIKIKTVQWFKSRIWQMKGGKYTRPSPRFGSEEYFLYEISEEMFYLNLQNLYGDAMLVLTWMGTNMADGETTKTSRLTEFCYKSVNLSLKELINIKVILFLIQLKTVLINSKIP